MQPIAVKSLTLPRSVKANGDKSSFLVEVWLTHRGEQVWASAVVSAFHRAARFTLGAAYALRAIPCGKGYNGRCAAELLRAGARAKFMPIEYAARSFAACARGGGVAAWAFRSGYWKSLLNANSNSK